MPCFDGQLCLSDRQASPSGAVDAEQPLGREILGRPLTAEGAAWCVYGLSLALAVVGAVLWFLNRDLGGAVFVPPLLLVRALPRSGGWWPCGAEAIGSAGCFWAWGWPRPLSIAGLALLLLVFPTGTST